MTVNRRRRRAPAGVLVSCLLSAALVLAACGGSDSGGSSSSSGSSSSASSGKKYNMTLIAGVKGDEFYITMNCGAQAEAKKLGVSLNFQGPDKFDPAQQTPIVNAVAAKKPDAVLDRADRHEGDVRADQAARRRRLEGRARRHHARPARHGRVADLQRQRGRRQARPRKTLAKLIGGSGKVFVNNVQPGISTTDARAKGFEEGAKAAGLTYLGQQFNNDDPAKAASISKSVLAKNPDLKGIFAANLFSAEGAATGVKEAGKTDQVKIVGFDAGPKQIADLKAGNGAGADRPEARRHRRAGRAAGLRRADRQADEAEDRHRVRVAHEGQPRREPGRRLQGVLLNRRLSDAAADRSGPKPNGGRGVGQACPRVAPSPRRSPRWRVLWRSWARPRPGWPPRRRPRPRPPQWSATPGRGRR